MPSSAAPSATSLNWAWQPLPRGAASEPVVRAWLGPQLGAGADRLPLHRDRRGRPHLGEPFAAYDCNWSHSGEGLLVVLGHGLQVGSDLEWQRPRARALELAQRYFTATEAQWLGALAPAPRERAFLRLWCAKEALLKAHGHGLSFGLHRLEFAEHAGRLQLRACDPELGQPPQWSLQEIEPAPGYLGALAWRRRPR